MDGLGRAVFYSKQVFDPRTAKSQPIWIKFCTHLLLHGIYRVGEKYRGHFVLRLVSCNFRNIDKICIKFGTNQSNFILNINS